ncbi:hypothetical protein EVAR_27628_1 [Eumeta japonica]|uniref:Uncharacterized protein n=1 Tax=Eumeta variegata TaxID=151549 RepID=A0A4C1V288_EUMVA|nr:hypothetical protein EVAR_27628_1 [Eumeta japonica]
MIANVNHESLTSFYIWSSTLPSNQQVLDQSLIIRSVTWRIVKLLVPDVVIAMMKAVVGSSRLSLYQCGVLKQKIDRNSDTTTNPFAANGTVYKTSKRRIKVVHAPDGCIDVCVGH